MCIPLLTDVVRCLVGFRCSECPRLLQRGTPMLPKKLRVLCLFRQLCKTSIMLALKKNNVCFLEALLEDVDKNK